MQYHTTEKKRALLGHDLRSQATHTMYVNDAIVTVTTTAMAMVVMTVLFDSL